MLTLTQGSVALTGGDAEADYADTVIWSSLSQLKGVSTNKLLLTFTRSSGVFTGTARLPGTARNLAFRGAAFQPLNRGGGYFLGTNQTGQILLSP